MGTGYWAAHSCKLAPAPCNWPWRPKLGPGGRRPRCRCNYVIALHVSTSGRTCSTAVLHCRSPAPIRRLAPSALFCSQMASCRFPAAAVAACSAPVEQLHHLLAGWCSRFDIVDIDDDPEEREREADEQWPVAVVSDPVAEAMCILQQPSTAAEGCRGRSNRLPPRSRASIRTTAQ